MSKQDVLERYAKEFDDWSRRWYWAWDNVSAWAWARLWEVNWQKRRLLEKAVCARLSQSFNMLVLAINNRPPPLVFNIARSRLLLSRLWRSLHDNTIYRSLLRQLLHLLLRHLPPIHLQSAMILRLLLLLNPKHYSEQNISRLGRPSARDTAHLQSRIYPTVHWS